MTDRAPRLLLVGIGHPDRGDDGIGPLVARRLAGRVSAHVTVLQRSGDALALIDDWAACDAVVLVDAAAPCAPLGGTPGRIHRVDLLRDPLPPELSLSSTHAFGVAEAVGLADALGLLPSRVIAYAIEAAGFEPGAPISGPVVEAAAAVETRVIDELRSLEMELRRNTTPGSMTHA